MKRVEDTSGARSRDGYLFDNAARQAGDRFDALASLFDPVTFRHFERLGVAEGWRCWEVGAGGGSVASWLARRVGASGHVTATDLDVRWLEEQLRAPNLDVHRHDVVGDPPPGHAFDLVHERLVLLHLPGRAEALSRLVSALRPGGWLLVEDFDSRGGDGFVDPQSPDEELGNRLVRGVRSLLAQRGADTALGYKLPRLLREAGLVDVGADGYRAIAGWEAIRRLERANIAQVAGQLVEQGLTTRDELDRYLKLLDDGAVDPGSRFLVSAWGRRPGT